MNERMKILQLLQEGKITAEQADLLLDALASQQEDSATTSSTRADEKKSFAELKGSLGDLKGPLGDLKNLGSQVSSAVTQALSEAKKAMETQFGDWSFSIPQHIMVTKEVSLSPHLESASVETKNGSVHAYVWDESYIKIQVRAQVKTNDIAEAQANLEQALQVNESSKIYQLTVVHGRGVGGASVDIYVPRGFEKLFLKTHNGSIQADSIEVQELHGETVNGGIVLFKLNTARIRVMSHNGRIDVQQSIGPTTRSLYATTHNGAVEVVGAADNLYCVGSAKTHMGRVDIVSDELTVDYDDANKRRAARFQHQVKPDEVKEETHIYLETHNGSISARI